MIFEDYNIFCEATKNKNRYIHGAAVMNFLDYIWETREDREVTLEKGYSFFRAQLGNGGYSIGEDEGGNKYEENELTPFSKERMKPNLNCVVEGRANPKGIAYLYLTTDLETAISEVKPFLGSTISLGIFKIKEELTLIECAYFNEFEDKKISNIKINNLSKEDKRKLAVWSNIDSAFSEPINSTDETCEYVPTQIIAEFFKSKGIDGIAHKSSLSKGANVVLFDLNMADLTCCYLYEVKSVDFKSEVIGITYSCK